MTTNTPSRKSKRSSLYVLLSKLDLFDADLALLLVLVQYLYLTRLCVALSPLLSSQRTHSSLFVYKRWLKYVSNTTLSLPVVLLKSTSTVLIDVRLMARTGGIHLLLHAINEGPAEMAPLISSAFLLLADSPRTRAYLHLGTDLEVFIILRPVHLYLLSPH